MQQLNEQLYGGNNMFMKDISAIYRFGMVFSQNEFKGLGISGGDNGIILFLACHKGTNQESISEYLMLDKGTIAKAVARLEELGYIRREVNPNNKREKNIYMTQKGEEIVDQIKNSLNEWGDYVLKNLSDEEKEKFIELADKAAQGARKIIYKEKNKS